LGFDGIGARDLPDRIPGDVGAGSRLRGSVRVEPATYKSTPGYKDVIHVESVSNIFTGV